MTVITHHNFYLPQNYRLRFSFWPWVCFARFFVAFNNFSGRRCCCICIFFLISFLFSLIKSKQTAVRGPTGGGRPPVTTFC